jgi:hypothetical protein
MKPCHDNSAVRFSMSFDELPIRPADVLSAVGYDPERVPLFLHEVIQEIIGEASSRCAIQGGYQVYGGVRVSGSRQSIHIEQRTIATDKIITAQLRNARQAAVFVCTAGHALEDWSSDLMRGEDPAKGYLINTLASLVVEAAMDNIHDHLEAESETRDLHVTNRFSPGYCGWPLTDAHQLFSMLPAGFCQISLNDSAFMTPAKSICGIIGIGPRVKRSAHTCGFCDRQDCVYRNQGVPEI